MSKDLRCCKVEHADMRKFVVWCHHRTGSTHLVSLIDSHPEAACWPEIFFAGEGHAVRDYYLDSSAASVTGFLEDFYNYEWGPSGVNLPGLRLPSATPSAIGFKLKYGQVARYPAVLNYLRSISDQVLFIHLRRVNLLAALVSEQALPIVFSRFGRPNVPTGVDAGDFRPRVALDPATVVDELERLAALVHKNTSLVDEFDVLNVTYEQLVAEPSVQMSRVMQFLGLSHEKRLRSRYRKIMPSDLRSTISNFDQVTSALSGTPFSGLTSQ